MKTRFWKGLSAPVFLAITTVVLMVSVSTLGLLTINQTLSSQGTVTIVSTPNLAIFSDSQCTQSLSAIDWGSITPGTPVTKTIYVKNTGNVPLTLSMSASNWSPTAATNSMALTWNKQNSALAVDQSTSAVLTLTVNPNISGITSFSVNIVIAGTG